MLSSKTRQRARNSIVIIFVYSGCQSAEWDERLRLLQTGLPCDKFYGCQRSTVACKIKFPWVV